MVAVAATASSQIVPVLRGQVIGLGLLRRQGFGRCRRCTYSSREKEELCILKKKTELLLFLLSCSGLRSYSPFRIRYTCFYRFAHSIKSENILSLNLSLPKHQNCTFMCRRRKRPTCPHLHTHPSSLGPVNSPFGCVSELVERITSSSTFQHRPGSAAYLGDVYMPLSKVSGRVQRSRSIVQSATEVAHIAPLPINGIHLPFHTQKKIDAFSLNQYGAEALLSQICRRLFLLHAPRLLKSGRQTGIKIILPWIVTFDPSSNKCIDSSLFFVFPCPSKEQATY